MRFGNSFGHYELEKFPGNSSIVVSTHAFIRPEYRGKGLGVEQHRSRLQIARNLGFCYVISTVREENEVEKHILTKHGWQKHDVYFNEETLSDIGIWGRSIVDVQAETYYKNKEDN